MEVDDEIEEGMVVDGDEAASVLSESRAGASPYEILKQSKASAEDIAEKMLDLKKNNGSKSELKELVAQMFINFVSLRQANRSILLEEDRVKGETEKAKAPVDFTTLQLHNLMYEKNHYVKAIKACKDFKSKYPDIDLVSEEEFLRDAPEEIKGAKISDDSAHNVMLKRLNYELYQRKELCKLKEKLEQKKKDLQETIANRKKFLSSLPSHLKTLKKASLPVQNQLGVLHTKKLKQHNSAELLPPPLYVIYSQFLAQKEAFEENIDLEIVGSLKDAQLFARQQATKENGISTDVESSRLEDDAIDEEDDGQRRRKRPKKVISGKDGLEDDKVYQSHPLKIILHVYDDESESKHAKLLTLKFEYLLKLNVVCVGMEGSDEAPENSILCNLFPDDAGVELPVESAKLSVGEAFVYDEKRNSRPYKWAQHLAGIDFLPEVSPLLASSESAGVEKNRSAAVVSGLSLYRQQNRVQTIVERLRSRKKAQVALQEQLHTLQKLKWPPLICEHTPWALQAHSCNVHSVSRLITRIPLTASTLEQPDVTEKDAYGKRVGSKDEVEGVREDGELPSLVPVMDVSGDSNLTLPKGSDIDRDRQLELISKAVPSLMNKAKSQSFKKLDEDPDLIMESDDEFDELAKNDADDDDDDLATSGCFEMNEKSMESYGFTEFSLVLMRKIESWKENAKLEAKIIISVEYPLRPPLFHVNICFEPAEGSCADSERNEWYNESRAIEAEVNLRVLRKLPRDQENHVLAHQVHCLALLFDLYTDEAYLASENGKSELAHAFSFHTPVYDAIHSRSIRGRDRRKMIPWNEMENT